MRDHRRAHAVAFANGTVSLHAALWATGIGKGDTVATSPLSFVASASCALWVDAQPAFIDIDPKTLNLDLGNVGRCDALIAVHYAGLPIDLSGLVLRPRVVIEDAAHALGASTPDGPVGNCAIRRVRVLVPPGEDGHDRRRRRGHHELDSSSPPACAASARTAWCRGRSTADGSTRSPS